MQQEKKQRGRLPLGAVLALDALALGLCLIVFALFHHVLPRNMDSGAVRPVSATPAPAPTTALPSPTPAGAAEEAEPEASPDPRSEWAIRFEEHFTDEVEITNASYTSPNVSVTVSSRELQFEDRKTVCYIADIYVSDVRCFRTYLAQNSFGRGIVDDIQSMARESGAVAAMTGDMYAYQGASLMLRNGELYRDGRWQTYQSHCALYYDGRMEVYGPDELDYESAMADGAWQIWSFGPILLKDGEIPDEFGAGMAVEAPNPRSALGYYEPGHYCFVVADGRRPAYSYGLSFKELAELFRDLGCSCAYNLDGGGSAAMTLGGEFVNQPSGGGRELSDIVLIAEPPEETTAETEEEAAT
ncbi:MAG: phosphodiester glycosidase family protein [Oscillospiraceae bacterium]|nr:phosphodiester glycosidase family protein [Oscillospiraceae bacterium]